MDGLTFYKVLNIIKRRYIQSTLNKITVVSDQMYLAFYKNGAYNLTFKTSPKPSLELSDTIFGDSKGALSVLNNSILSNIDYRAYDRIGWMEFLKRRPSGKIIKYLIFFEPMGNYSNAFLTDSDWTILYTLNSRSIDPNRSITLGSKYTLPKLNKKYTLNDSEQNIDFIDMVGFAPATAHVAEEYSKKIGYHPTVNLILEELQYGNNFYITDKNKIFPFPPIENHTVIDFDKLVYSISAAANDTDRYLSNLKKFYNKELDHYSNLLIKLSKELEEAKNWEIAKNEADLIKSNLPIIKSTGKYTLKNYSDEGVVEVEYEYKQKITPREHMEKLYKKALKLKRSITKIENRIVEVDQLKLSATEQISYLEDASPTELKELSILLKDKSKNKKVSTKPYNTNEFDKHEIGECILYTGKNSTGNHKLVFDFARPNDLWFHAHNIPSAHGILRINGKVSDSELEQAAEIIAGKSKHKGELKVEVDYTLKKYVKKPKGTPTGFVTYTNFKSILVKINS